MSIEMRSIASALRQDPVGNSDERPLPSAKQLGREGGKGAVATGGLGS